MHANALFTLLDRRSAIERRLKSSSPPSWAIASEVSAGCMLFSCEAVSSRLCCCKAKSFKCRSSRYMHPPRRVIEKERFTDCIHPFDGLFYVTSTILNDAGTLVIHPLSKTPACLNPPCRGSSAQAQPSAVAAARQATHHRCRPTVLLEMTTSLLSLLRLPLLLSVCKPSDSACPSSSSVSRAPRVGGGSHRLTYI